jgi:hypothetical protein
MERVEINVVKQSVIFSACEACIQAGLDSSDAMIRACFKTIV